MLVCVVAHRPDPVAHRDGSERKRRIDPSTEANHPSEDSLAVDGAHGPAQRPDEPEQEDDAEADQYPAEVDAVSVAAVGVPPDDLCRRRIAGRRTTEEQDRPDDEQDDVDKSSESCPARHAARVAYSDCVLHRSLPLERGRRCPTVEASVLST